MTKSSSAESQALITEILRRSAHEIRNALNGVAVNVEVVRSRSAKSGSAGDTAAFAERAVTEVATASALMDGTLAVAQAFVEAVADGRVISGKKNGAGEKSFTLTAPGPRMEGLRAAMLVLAPRIGVRVESTAKAVIFTVLPDSSSHSPSMT